MKPTPEQWQLIYQLFGEVVGLPSHQRAALLSQATDDDVRQEVEALLIANDNAVADTAFLNTPALEVAAQTLAEENAMTMLGKEIGHYKILSLLGRGGMGEVYLAQDTKLGRHVALKILPPEFTRDGERVQRFRQEARAASALNHPNIITIFAIDEADGMQFIATEFIDGATLRDRLSEAAFSVSEALEIAIQIANALAEAHAVGIIHRDIKPENVMLRKDGIVKVLDFGLAKLNASFEGAQSFHTEAGKVMGTPRYMSPEQIRGQAVDVRTDLFSFGVVLYEMIAGRVPFAGETTADTIAAILEHDPAPLAASVELQRLVGKALAKDRDTRWANIKVLLDELKTTKRALELSEHEAQSTLTMPAQFPPVQHSHPLEPAGGAVPLDSRFYIVRPADEEFRTAIGRQDSIVLLKGARQVGKTSLLARGLQQARQAGAKVVLTDLQKLSADDLTSAESFYLALADLIADQLDLDVVPEDVWNARRGASINFERFIRREVLGKLSAHLVWGLDEVDRLFACAFGSEVFGLFRSWHNERSLDPQGPWQRLTMAIAYATEAHLFISDMNQSPFNVGTRLALEDFTPAQVAELNQRYGAPLQTSEVASYYELVSGHPYLVRCGLQEMVTHQRSLSALTAIADHEDGPFGDHLRRIVASLEQDKELSDIVRGLLRQQPCPTQESFYRLRSAGVIVGDSARDARPRCQLYATYLAKRLL
ncbi:MAG: AAA-like domain-containing protein [Blastocatellia bacterium]|nr:AAA-like domain-containing protein [Blastocatellia bacterium]